MRDSDLREALRLITQRDANAEAGPCPNCEGEMHVDLMDVPTYQEARWLPYSGEPKCIARCWQSDPDGYVASINARKSFIAQAATRAREEAEALMDRTPEEVRRRLAYYDTQESDA